jgi:molybdopterin-guanine dinucleotide biosynthesis protein A
MGFDKARMSIDGVSSAIRIAALVRTVTSIAFEVGPGVSGLPAVQEEYPGYGPLVAVGAGSRALTEAGHVLPALVLACDLPLMTEGVLRQLAQWPGEGSVVPVVGGHPQPLCARWSAEDLAASIELARSGKRSMRVLLERPGIVFLDTADWPRGVDPAVFADADTPADLDRLGLRWCPAADPF